MTKQYTFALAGNQNSGKTTLFNVLTGSNQHVGNWPGVTVEQKTGVLMHHHHGGDAHFGAPLFKGKKALSQADNSDVKIVDLPGIYSLSPFSMEEVVTRNFITLDKPDVVINIVDATNLERNLYLTMQLRQLGTPMVVALNMMDEVRAHGDVIKLDVLEKDRTQRLAHPLLAGFKTPFKINVGKLNGGNWPSAVPDQAVMEIRYGMSPMETVEQAKAEFEDYINRIADADPWLKDHHPVVEWLGCCWHPYSMDTDDAFVQMVAANHEAVVGNDATICGIAVAADAALYSRFLEIPSILFGPGEVTVAHQANEYVEINKMMDATKVIAATIMDWCGYQDAE